MQTPNLWFIKFDVESARAKLEWDLIDAAFIAHSAAGRTYHIIKQGSKWLGRLGVHVEITEAETLRECAIRCSNVEGVFMTQALKDTLDQPKMVGVVCTTHAVRDSHGQVAVRTSSEPSQTIIIQNLKKPNGAPLHFEMPVTNLRSWCELHGLKYETKQLTVTMLV